MSRYRPTAVLVLAILHLVGGGLGLVFTLVGLGFQAMTMNNPAAAPAPTPAAVTAQNFGATLVKHYETAIPSFSAVQGSELAVGLLLDVLLLAAGVGLLHVRPWARTTSLGYAVLSIVNRLFGMIYQLAVVLPVTDAFLNEVASQSPGMATAVTAGRVSGYFGVVLSFVVILYPVAVLVILLRPRVAAAFREGPPPEVPAGPEDYLDADRPFRRDEPPSDAITR